MKTIFDPEKIALKKFVIRWRGYDTREVETFLRAVAVDFRRLIDHTAAADQPVATGQDLADVRAELGRLSSQLDRALAGLEAVGSTGSTDIADAADVADLADRDWNAELRLLASESGRG
jgi:DivIVA domain-containing protein